MYPPNIPAPITITSNGSPPLLLTSGQVLHTHLPSTSWENAVCWTSTGAGPGINCGRGIIALSCFVLSISEEFLYHIKVTPPSGDGLSGLSSAFCRVLQENRPILSRVNVMNSEAIITPPKIDLVFPTVAAILSTAAQKNRDISVSVPWSRLAPLFSRAAWASTNLTREVAALPGFKAIAEIAFPPLIGLVQVTD